ncbi:MAG TPA: ADP-ribose diphosphatase [Chromatiales bacterium]|nr:ADP-ribose diphosphatase [Chromatiales bacterium]
MSDDRRMTRDDAEILDREILWRGYFRMERYRVRHRRFDGGWGAPVEREVFERGHAAALLPYDPARDAVVLIEQFRIGALAAGANPWLAEIVAGIIEKGETAEEVVRREMVEEAGCTVDLIEPIVDAFTTPGGSSERIALFCGRVDSQGVGGIHGLADEGEDIRVFVERLDEAVARIGRGEITNLIAVAALQWLALNRDRLRRQWLDPTPSGA